MYFLDIRRTLTPEQWQKLKAMREEHRPGNGTAMGVAFQTVLESHRQRYQMGRYVAQAAQPLPFLVPVTYC